MAALDKDDLVGQILLHYQVTERLGAGGMGVVYRAVDLKLKRTVALKFLTDTRSIDRETRERFLREAMASSALDHSNIGTLHAVEESDGQMFLVMACYKGPTLAETMSRGPMAADEAVEVAMQIAQGLDEAHRHGIVHRDIKPGNIIFNAQGLIKILDFGLAKLHGSPDLTHPGSTLGTAAYMPPEQIMGDTVDQRADLWALGVVLYEMLSGRRLFRGPDLPSTIHAVMSKEPERIGGLPQPLEVILDKALKRDPEQRYQTAPEMIAHLKAARGTPFKYLSDDPTSSGIDALKTLDGRRGTTTLPALVPATSRNRRSLVVASALLLAIVATAVAGFAVWRHKHAVESAVGVRIAVLPLAVDSEEGGNNASAQAFSDGLRGQLIESLTGLESANKGLLVVPGSQVTAQHVDDPDSARRSLGADIVLAGSVARSKDGVRVALSAIDTSTAKILKSEIVEGKDTDMAGLERKMLQTSMKMFSLRPAVDASAAQRLSGLSPDQTSLYLTSLGYLERWDKPGNLDTATEGLEHLTGASPNFSGGYIALAECYRRRYESTKDTHALELADQNAARAVQTGSRLAEVSLAVGQVRVLQGRYPEAVEEFEHALTLDPRSDDAYRGLAKAYAALGVPDKAEDAWNKAIALRPTSFYGYNQLAIFEMGRAGYTKASENFRKALAQAPDNANILSNLGAALVSAGSDTDARKVLQRAIQLRPSYSSYTNLGNLDLKEGHFSDAAGDYEKALELNKTDYRVWSNMGVAYSRVPGNKDKAKDAFLQAAKMCRASLKANPNDPVVLSDLAMFVASEGDERQEPLVLIERALALAPEDTYVQFNAAETYESLGYRKEALDWVKKLIAAGYSVDDINDSPVLSDLVKDARYQAALKTR